MKTRPIPRTTLTASVLCLGTAAFGSAIDYSSSEKILETYLDAGGNVLDTAEIYAAWLPNGEHRSETFLGEWLDCMVSIVSCVLSRIFFRHKNGR
ncbi:MAG: aldo/keto reductase [Chthoniobacterales bacterium]